MEALRISVEDLLKTPEAPVLLSSLERSEMLEMQSIPDIKLTKDEVVLATGLHMVERTRPGHWYVGDSGKTGPVGEMCEEMGGLQSTPVRAAIIKMSEAGLAKTKFKEMKGSQCLSDVMLTKAGRKEFIERQQLEPETAERIRQVRMAQLYKTIALVRREVDNEYRELEIDNPRQFVSFSSLEAPALAKEYLETLRKTQRGLLKKIDALDERRRLQRQHIAFWLPKAA